MQSVILLIFYDCRHGQTLMWTARESKVAHGGHSLRQYARDGKEAVDEHL